MEEGEGGGWVSKLVQGKRIMEGREEDWME